MNSCILLILHFFVLRIIGVIDWISISLSGLSIETFTNFRFVHAYRCRRIFDVTAVFFHCPIIHYYERGTFITTQWQTTFSMSIQCSFAIHSTKRERRLTRINFSHKKKIHKIWIVLASNGMQIRIKRQQWCTKKKQTATKQKIYQKDKQRNHIYKTWSGIKMILSSILIRMYV